ncbi:MAG: polysaccharide biosynthesis/export family protein, partial [Halomonas sp.]
MNVIAKFTPASLKHTLAVASIAVVGTFTATTTWAQALSLSDSILPQQSSQQSGQGAGAQEQVEDTPRADWRSGTYGPISMPQQSPDDLPPFGANLFTGGFRGAMGDGLNPDYRIKPGDQVTVRAWGAFEFDRVLP